jgi:hypothetical protein
LLLSILLLPGLPIGLLRLLWLLLAPLLLLGRSALGLFIEFSVPPPCFVFLFFRHPGLNGLSSGGLAGLLCSLCRPGSRLPSHGV